MRKKAFTLAELLVALGIVGVIAALTLPSLMNMKQEASAGPQLSKVKASVEDAASRILLEDPSKNLKEYNTDFAGKISEYLVMSTAEGGGYRLKDGVVIDFEEATGGHVSNASGSAFKKVNVDLNGTSKPNVAGVDKFEFLLSTQGLLVPQGCAAKLASNNWKVSKDYDSATCSSYTMGETIEDTITEGEEYTPEGTKTCPDGTVIPSYLSCESNPNCTPIACGCGESWSALDCDCKPTPGFTKTCTGGKVWSETDCGCVTPTPQPCTPKSCTGGTVWSQAVCDCVPGITPEPCDTWERIQCGLRPNHEWDEATCSCNKKQEPEPCVDPGTCGCGTWDSVNCKCIPADTECLGGHWDSSICSCVEDDVPEPEPCSDPGTCSCGEQWDAEQCKCVAKSGFSTDCACGEEWDSAQCKCVAKSGFSTDCSNELQTWDESSCSCKTTKKKCPDGSIVALNANCPILPCCTNSFAHMTGKEPCRPCDNPSYCCDCSRPYVVGDRCIEGNSSTPDCYAGCGIKR